MKFKAIGFDYAGVVAGITSAELNVGVSALLGVDVPTFQESYFKFNQAWHNNKIPVETFWEEVMKDLGQSDKLKKIIDFINSLPNHRVNRDVLGLVDNLRAVGYKVGILSNNSLERAKKIRESELANHFDAIVVSAEIGHSKPTPEAFEIFFGKLGVQAKDAIFIDDSQKSLSRASEIGFHPVFFNNYEDLVGELKKLDVI